MKGYFDAILNQDHGSKNTPVVEIFLSLGALVGIGLTAVMLRAGW